MQEPSSLFHSETSKQSKKYLDGQALNLNAARNKNNSRNS